MNKKRKKSNKKGWRREPVRHGLASQGIKTVIDDDKRFRVDKFISRGKNDDERIDELYDKYKETIDFWDFSLTKEYDEDVGYYYVLRDVQVTTHHDTIEDVEEELKEAKEQMKTEKYRIKKSEEEYQEYLDESIKEYDQYKSKKK